VCEALLVCFRGGRCRSSLGEPARIRESQSVALIEAHSALRKPTGRETHAPSTVGLARPLFASRGSVKPPHCRVRLSPTGSRSSTLSTCNRQSLQPLRLTLPSRGRPQCSFAALRPPLMSNVRAERRWKCNAIGAAFTRGRARPIGRGQALAQAAQYKYRSAAQAFRRRSAVVRYSSPHPLSTLELRYAP
jgi:hypothetical protein